MGVLYSVIHKTRSGKQFAGGQRTDYIDCGKGNFTLYHNVLLKYNDFH